MYGNWFVEPGVWGFATIARYYSTTDGTQHAKIIVNTNVVYMETWDDKPLLDNPNNIKTLGA